MIGTMLLNPAGPYHHPTEQYESAHRRALPALYPGLENEPFVTMRTDEWIVMPLT